MNEEQRNRVRLKTHAKVLIKGWEVPGYLRDLSQEGCQISLTRPLELKREEALAVAVLPDPEAGIASFNFFVQVLWTRADPVFFNLGGPISPFPGELHEQGLRRLFDFYQ
jgi:hypothetical protein